MALLTVACRFVKFAFPMNDASYTGTMFTAAPAKFAARIAAAQSAALRRKTEVVAFIAYRFLGFGLAVFRAPCGEPSPARSLQRLSRMCAAPIADTAQLGRATLQTRHPCVRAKVERRILDRKMSDSYEALAKPQP